MKAIGKDINMNFGLENGVKICYKKKYSQRKMYVGSTLCRTKIHRPDILYILLRQSRDVQLPP
jgi:hypothetical protein